MKWVASISLILIFAAAGIVIGCNDEPERAEEVDCTSYTNAFDFQLSACTENYNDLETYALCIYDADVEYWESIVGSVCQTACMQPCWTLFSACSDPLLEEDGSLVDGDDIDKKLIECHIELGGCWYACFPYDEAPGEIGADDDDTADDDDDDDSDV